MEVMAQCRWHCNYKDFSQLLMRWCFHVPASIIRLTPADFLYVNERFIGLFPPEKISLLHANVAALPPPVESRSKVRPPAGTGFPSIEGCLGPASCTAPCAACAAVTFFCKLDMLPRDYPTLWAAAWRKNPFERVTETWHASVLLPADTDWIKGRNDTRRELRIQPGSP